MKAKMTASKWEKTTKDKSNDKAGAKKMGVSVAKYERSSKDAKQDAAEIKKYNSKLKKK